VVAGALKTMEQVMVAMMVVMWGDVGGMEGCVKWVVWVEVGRSTAFIDQSNPSIHLGATKHTNQPTNPSPTLHPHPTTPHTHPSHTHRWSTPTSPTSLRGGTNSRR
jgi:hypothetical protein